MRIFAVLLLPALLLAQEPPRDPAIAVFGVRNGASLAPAGWAQGPILAPGSIFAVKGAWLGPDELVHASGPYPVELAGSQLEIRPLGGGEVYLAPLIHAWTFQVAGVLPEDLPPGQAEVTAIFEGRRSEPVQFRVDESAPALFSVGQTGIGPAVVQNWESPDSTPLNSFTRSAKPGQTVILWGTGLNNGDGSRDIRVVIGEGDEAVEARPFYAGPAPGLPGVDQINLTLPTEGVPEGCLQRLSVAVGNESLGSGTLSIAAGDGPCVHPWGLSEAELRTLDEGGQIRFAKFLLSDTELPNVGNSDPFPPVVVAQARTLLVAADGLESITRDSEPHFSDASLSCGDRPIVGGLIGGPIGEPLPEPPPPDQLPLEFAHAGDTLQLAGPDGQGVDLIPDVMPGFPESGIYRQSEPLEPGFFTPGEWTLRAPGGERIDAFEGSLTVPPFPSIVPPERIRRDEGLSVSWDHAGYTEDQRVRVDLVLRYRDETGAYRSRVTGCEAQATSGALSITQEAFAGLPASTDGFAEFTVIVTARGPAFQAPALSHGRAFYWASRSARVPFE